MAKKHFGKLLTLAAIVGAAAAGVSYVLQYKSFHKELDEDFHDFEDDFDDFEDEENETSESSDTTAAERSYVSLTPDKKDAEPETETPDKEASSPAPEVSATVQTDTTKEPSDEVVDSKLSAAEIASTTSASPTVSDENATVTVEEITE